MAQVAQIQPSPSRMSSRKNKLQQSQKAKKLDPESLSIVNTAQNIANYYIPYHLRSNCKHDLLNGLPKDFLIPPAQPSETYIHLSMLCTKMEKHSGSFFEELPTVMKLKCDNAKSVFMNVCSKVFCDNIINWGRVVSVFTLGGVFAVHFVNKGQLDIVKKIPSWIEEIVEKQLTGWIKEQGGWDKIKSSEGNSTNTSWTSYVTVGGFVAAAGVILLGLRK